MCLSQVRLLSGWLVLASAISICEIIGSGSIQVNITFAELEMKNERTIVVPKQSTREILYFDRIKEDKGIYFVEYQPPVSQNAFATINLVYPQKYELQAVADVMKEEVDNWLARYPVPLMVSAWDASENRIRPHGDVDEGYLYGWQLFPAETMSYSWRADELPSLFNGTTEPTDWRSIYKDVPFRTDSEVKVSAKKSWDKQRKQNLTLKVVLALWLGAIPAAWAIFQYLGPQWLALTVLLYSLFQALRTTRKLFWHVEPSSSEKEKAERKLKMDHYFYHCELNQNGFARLKAENFERETIARNLEESRH